MSDNFFGKNLKYIREKRGMTQQEIADLVGRKSTGSISDWESGRTTPNAGNISKIANFFDLKIDDMVERDIQNQENIPTNLYKPIFRNIPIIGVIACGEPITAEENVEGYIPTIEEDLPSGDLFYLKASGRSMEPIINSGSSVLCRAQSDVENGEIAAVLVNGDTEATLKRVRKTDKFVLLEAINEEYPPYLITEENPAHIIGKAIRVYNIL